jgi:predicted enzyme related to lactoylglutathione lyase
VDDIDDAITIVQAHAAEIVFEREAIPGVGHQAFFKDTSGIVEGLPQAEPRLP